VRRVSLKFGHRNNGSCIVWPHSLVSTNEGRSPTAYRATRKNFAGFPSTVVLTRKSPESDLVDATEAIGTTEGEATDDQLVAAAQYALPAFEHLYRRYVNDIYRFCYRRLGTESDAADATSVVFTRALTNIKSCNVHSFRPWLFTIARNVVTDQYRSMRATGVLDETYRIPDQADGPEELAIRSDERRSLAAVMSRLTDEQRSIIELRLAGLSAQEIAMALGKTRNAIDQMQYRAVSRLRTLLASPVPQMEETPQ
jgi:RNA polymerase sigma-70 factor, ECF subfamily